MIKVGKRVLSLLLSLVMLVSLMSISAYAAPIAVGTNGKTFYLSTEITDKNNNVLHSIAKDDYIYVKINFAGNSTILSESVRNYNLFVAYDGTKMSYVGVDKKTALTVPQANSPVSGIVKLGWDDTNGIYKVEGEGPEAQNVLQESGVLTILWFKATADLTQQDIDSIRIVNQYHNDTLKVGNYTVLQVPAITVALKSGVDTIYDTTTADELKTMLDVNYIDAQGNATPVTNFDVVLPSGSLTAGPNQVTVSDSASGLSETLTVSATADTVTNIAVTTQPKLIYTSGDQLDLSDMVVTATCASGKTKQVTDYSTAIGDTAVGSETVLKVADHNGKTITVTYNDLTAVTGALAVGKRSVTTPVATGTYTYNGSQQEFTYSNSSDDFTVTGETVGTDANTYTATAVLKDKEETAWANGSSDDQTLRWTIVPLALANANLKLVISSDSTLTYNGDEQTLTDYKVYSGEKELVAGTNYTVVESSAKGIDAKAYSLTVTGQGNYSGSYTFANGWTITPKSIENVTIGAIDDQPYTGKQITPTPEVKDGEKELTSGTDFTYSYSNNQYVGTATVTINGKSNYQGAANKGFAITAVEDPAVITATANVTKGGNTLDLNSLVTGAKGTVSFAISGEANGCSISGGVLTSGDTTGSVTVTVTVASKDENNDGIAEYTGKSGSIAVTVTDKTTAALAGGVTQQGCTFGDTLSAPTYTEPDGTQSTTVSYTGTLRKDGTSYSSAAKPIEAGTYKVTVTCETATHIYSATSADFTIAPKSITGATVTLGTSLTYSGSKQTQNVSEVKLGDKILNTADYTLSDNTATNAGSYNLTVTGTGNYTDSVQQAFTVAKKSITPNVEVTGTYTYTGSAIKPTVTVKAGNTPLAETDYALEYSNNTDAGEATVTVKATANGNYSFTDTEKKFTIAQADYSGTKTANASAKYGAAGELDLNNVLNPTAGWTFGAASVTRGNDVFAADSVKVADGKLSFQFVNDSSKVNSTATVKIPVTSTNYNNFDLEVTLTVLAKTAQTLSAAPIAMTYGDAAKKIEVSGAVGSLSYEVTDGMDIVSVDTNGNVTAIKSGTATITITAAETSTHASGSTTVTVTIAKRALTVKADDKTAYIGDKQPELTYTVSGLVGNDKLTPVPTLKLVHDANVDPMKQAGTYVIGFETEPAASANYELSAQTGTLTVSARPSYVGPTGNAVSVDRTENGKISVSPSYAAKGATVTITVTPDKGQELKSLEVIDQNGNSLPLTDLGNGRFSFVMPAGKVTVKPVFGAADAYRNPYADVQTNDWYFGAVQYVTENGLMNGTGNGFEPNLATSRAMIWTILARMSDVNTASSGEWYAVAQQWAIANGVSDGTMPNGTITREQLAAMLYRYAVSKGMVKGPATADLSVFADANSVSNYAVEAMQWAVSTGLIGGMDGKLNPQGSATRAQVATMLMRFAELAK